MIHISADRQVLESILWFVTAQRKWEPSVVWDAQWFTSLCSLLFKSCLLFPNKNAIISNFPHYFEEAYTNPRVSAPSLHSLYSMACCKRRLTSNRGLSRLPKAPPRCTAQHSAVPPGGSASRGRETGAAPCPYSQPQSAAGRAVQPALRRGSGGPGGAAGKGAAAASCVCSIAASREKGLHEVSRMGFFLSL